MHLFSKKFIIRTFFHKKRELLQKQFQVKVLNCLIYKLLKEQFFRFSSKEDKIGIEHIICIFEQIN